MTDEEMAEEYADKTEEKDWEGFDTTREIRKQAFLAGLKESKGMNVTAKWHKVADGDYPPCEKDNYTITVLTNKCDIAYYSYNYDCWIAEPSGSEIDPPIAWCEIPTYKDKQ